MFRNFVWLLAAINTVLIGSFFFFAPPLELITTFQVKSQLSIYLIWLAFNSAMFCVLIAKADMVGEGAVSFLGFSVNGTIALAVITGLYMFLAKEAIISHIFIVAYTTVLAITLFGQLMTNAYCFDKPAPQ
jgi:hypothetical protein